MFLFLTWYLGDRKYRFDGNLTDATASVLYVSILGYYFSLNVVVIHKQVCQIISEFFFTVAIRLILVSREKIPSKNFIFISSQNYFIWTKYNTLYLNKDSLCAVIALRMKTKLENEVYMISKWCRACKFKKGKWLLKISFSCHFFQTILRCSET